MARWWCVVGVLAGVTAGSAFADGTSLKAEVDRLVQPMVVGGWIAGASIAIVRGDATHLAGYGSASPRSPAPPGPDTVFEIGSVTKVFTATLLADLVSTGRLKLDQPVSQLLPAGVKMPSRGGREVTLLHLATHTSGLPCLPDNLTPRDPTNPYADYDAKKLYSYLARSVLESDPGAVHVYSNLGAGLLGHALACATGKTYEQLVLERICRPLRMTSTRVKLTADMFSRLAQGRDADGNPAGLWDLVALEGAGGLRSDLHDMVRFLRAQLGQGAGALQPALEATHGRRFGIRRGVSIGLGWIVEDRPLTLWHNGGTGGFRSFVGFHPDRKCGVVVLASSSSDTVDLLGDGLLKLASGQSPGSLGLPLTVVLPPEKLGQYVGRYRLAPKVHITVALEGDHLVAQLTGQQSFRLFASALDRFYYRAVSAQIRFERGPTGEVRGLVLRQDGREVPGPREQE